MKATVSITLTQSQLKNAAMVAQGLNPKALGMKPGTRRMQDRKAELKRGAVKHKGKGWE